MGFVDIPVSHGHLEGIFWESSEPRAAVLVCHPHPQHGGTMHNHVTYRVADAFRKLGCSALRFNFRGVGRSTGSYDFGNGEVEDGRAALDFLAQQCPGAPLYAAGFSFGSRVALRLALDDARVEKTMAVGMAVDLFDFDFVAKISKPKAFLHADRDEYGTLEKVRELVARTPDPKALFMIPDCTHLADGRLEAFAEVAAKGAAWLLDV